MLEIVYDDAHIAVCVKPVGTSAQAEVPGAMPQLLRAQLGCEAVFPVHRLDQIVGGVMVYAKTQPAAAALSRQVQAGGPERQADTLCDLLYHDRTKNKTYVVTRKRAGAREARLAYTLVQRVPDGADGLSLVRVQLFTGRTHQIRAQMSHAGWPLLGDGKYGSERFNRGYGEKGQALYSYKLKFDFPTDAGILEYLRGKIFTVRSVDFAEKYFGISELNDILIF